FVPRNLDQALVLGLQVVREHDADDPDIAALVRAVHGPGLAALGLRPFADRAVVGGGLRHMRSPVALPARPEHRPGEAVSLRFVPTRRTLRGEPLRTCRVYAAAIR